ncbi:hypothetical protein X975_23320, partial [Stegodyphus mimosarum]
MMGIIPFYSIIDTNSHFTFLKTYVTRELRKSYNIYFM